MRGLFLVLATSTFATSAFADGMFALSAAYEKDDGNVVLMALDWAYVESDLPVDPPVVSFVLGDGVEQQIVGGSRVTWNDGSYVFSVNGCRFTVDLQSDSATVILGNPTDCARYQSFRGTYDLAYRPFMPAN